MSFGFSASDLRLAWQLGSFLHEKCFTRAQGAGTCRSSGYVGDTVLTSNSTPDILYLRFGREIESFTESLQQLEAVIDHANRQRPRRPWRTHDDECRHALQPLSQLVGDFKKTLDECEKLLNDHERFQRDTAGFVDNVVWHVSTQRDVDILRERVHFHTTKVSSKLLGVLACIYIKLTPLAPCRQQAFRNVSPRPVVISAFPCRS